MKKIKVLIVDDSSVIRGLVKEIINQDNELEVVGEAQDPFVAREKIKQLNPDVITLDIEMPKMDGITFLSNLMRLRPMPVIMLSTLTEKGADITLKALELGAVDFITKPSFESLVENRMVFKDALISKIKSAISVDQKGLQLASALAKSKDNSVLEFTGCKRSNHLIAIGASTGGTDAIKAIVTRLPSNSPPVVITQHIPPKFSERFANRLNEHCEVNVQEAKHGQKIKDGNVYIAPGDQHLHVVAKGGALFCTLTDDEPVNRHKPAVDVLFSSLLPFADNIQAVLLTGMGSDGAKGMLELKKLGARTIIQDKNTSLIWGMPGSAHALSAQSTILPLNKVAIEVLDFARLSLREMKEVMDG